VKSDRASDDDTRTLTRWMIGVGVVVAVWSALAVPTWATYNNRTTADEPQYLLTARSIWEDGSLDVSDEIREENFQDFHQTRLNQQTEAFDDGREISPHDPLLPLVLAVPMGLGGPAGAKGTLSVLAGVVASAIVWVAVRRLAVPVATAGIVAAAFGVAAPLSAYGSQVYPELPAALAVTGAIGALTGQLRRGGLALLAVCVVALPWLSVKYVAVAAVLALLGALALVRQGRARTLLVLAGVLVVSGVVYAIAHRVLYGGWTVYAAGDHFVESGEAGVIGFHPDYWGRSRRLVGLMVDRSFGLAAWAPLYLLVIPAIGALARRRPPHWMVLGLPLLAGWLMATFVALTMHGYWWPGRQMVVVLPAAVLIVAWWAGRWPPARWLVVGGGALAALFWGWVVVEVLAEHRRLIIDFDDTTNPVYQLWRAFLPEGRSVSARHQLVTAAWGVAFVLLGWLGWRSVPPTVEPEELEELLAGSGAADEDAPAGELADAHVPTVDLDRGRPVGR
jgi:hypothetical protein